MTARCGDGAASGAPHDHGVPALEAALDAETDGRFAMEYAALR
jgi:hypothetical protein